VNPDVRVRAGDNRQTMSLALQKIADTVTVARDRQEWPSSDRRRSDRHCCRPRVRRGLRPGTAFRAVRISDRRQLWHSTLNCNYLGTYIFTSLAAFQAGTPSNFTQRVGSPNVDFSMLNAAAYVQDDFRVRRNF